MNKYFLLTVARLALASVVTLGVPEYFLHSYATDHPDVLARHYTRDNVTGVYTFVPVEGCELPPAQPFGLMFSANAFKLTVMVAIFGTLQDDLESRRHDKVPLWKRAATKGLIVYQMVIIPVSMAATITHFIGTRGGYPSRWAAYECFGVLWTLGPWWFNGMLLIVKEAMNYEKMGRLFGLKVRESFIGLLHEADDVEDLEAVKTFSYMMMCMLTFYPYLLVWLPYAVTHVIPALAIFIPEVGLIAIFFGSVLFMTSRDESSCFGRWTLFTQVNADDAEPTGGLVCLPLLLLMSVLAEVLMLQAVYFYAGDGWAGSITEVFIERQTAVYMASFKARVLHVFYAATDLLNELV